MGKDPLCPLGFHPQVRWPTRCKRCFRYAHISSCISSDINQTEIKLILKIVNITHYMGLTENLRSMCPQKMICLPIRFEVVRSHAPHPLLHLWMSHPPRPPQGLGRLRFRLRSLRVKKIKILVRPILRSHLKH
jgi:hypothetical protein